MYLSASEFGQAEIRDGGTGGSAVEPPSTQPCQDASEGTGWGKTSGSSRVSGAVGLPLGPNWLAHQPAKLTQLIPLAVRDSCQTVPAFWSLSAQARFKLVSCGRPWISSSLLQVIFPLFFKLGFILLGRWCWCWLQRGHLNLESWEAELTSPAGFNLGVQGLHRCL